MIDFNCPNCGRGMRVKDEHAGKTGQCKQCSQNVVIPFPVLAATKVEPVQELIRAEPAQVVRQVECPICGELISPSARKCRHCNEFLDGSAKPKPVQHVTAPVAAPQITINNSTTATIVSTDRKRKRYSPFLAFLLSALLPGLGQLYSGRFLAGIGWFVFTAVGYVAFIVPGVILHVLCALSVGMSDPYS